MNATTAALQQRTQQMYGQQLGSMTRPNPYSATAQEIGVGACQEVAADALGQAGSGSMGLGDAAGLGFGIVGGIFSSMLGL